MMGALLAMSAGIVSWSFAEYLIHRFLGHEPKTRPNPFATEHIRHHVEGNYFAPTWKKGLTAVIATCALAWPAVSLAGATAGLLYVLGFVGAYLGYELMHRREHTHPGAHAYARWARRHHFHHHFGDPTSNHGVTSPVWDWVFGTLQDPGVVRVPRTMVMAWLVDPATGDVQEEFAAHYVLGAKP